MCGAECQEAEEEEAPTKICLQVKLGTETVLREQVVENVRGKDF